LNLGGAISSFNWLLDDLLREGLNKKLEILVHLKNIQGEEKDPIVSFLIEFKFLVFVFCRMHCNSLKFVESPA
jgi:hypothetical protein